MSKKLTDFFALSGGSKRCKYSVSCDKASAGAIENKVVNDDNDQMNVPTVQPQPSCSTTSETVTTASEKVTTFNYILKCQNEKGSSMECGNDLPDCWNDSQKNEFCQKYDWLFVKNGKLGCSVCKQVGVLSVHKKMGMKISKEWACNDICSYGDTREKRQTSLRKKIYEHKESAGHKAAVKIVCESKNEVLEKVVLKQRALEKHATEKVFRTAYKVVKENQSFNNFETEVDLQELNGLDMGRILHSDKACANIALHISKEMKKTYINEIMNNDAKIGLIIDESTSLSNKSSLIVYIRCSLPKIGMCDSTNVFLDLVELDGLTAKAVFDSLLNCLHGNGITDSFLSKNLTSITCDGAATMIGKNKGVGALFSSKFPSIIVWHCANHRLELSVSDVVKAVSGVDRFKSFIDKLYVVYHASPKNSCELRACANLLEAQLVKIGRVLSTRWVASSFRSVSAVWTSYEALVSHFEGASKDPTRDSKEKSMFEGLLKKITDTNFILDLGLMADALQELSELSEALQHRNVDLSYANKKLKITAALFEERKSVSGFYSSMALESVNNLSFFGVPLHKRESRKDNMPLNSEQFYETLKNSIETRLLSEKDFELADTIKILDQTNWPKDVPVTFGENEIRKLASKFKLNERHIITGFREYLYSRVFPENLLPLKQAINSIAISSSECERGFSQMNLIITPLRSSLNISTVSSLLFLKINGPPLRLFNPDKYVDSWLLSGHHSALAVKSRERSRDKKYDENMLKFWSIF